MIPSAEIPAPLALYMDGLRSHDLAKIKDSFAGDVQFVTPARTMESSEILSFLAALYRGFPDWKYVNDPPIRTGQGAIGVRWYQGGTHSETLSFPGFPAYQATGKTVKIPPHFFYYLVDDQGLHEIRPDPIPGGAPRGIFEQIGVENPPL